MWFHNLKLFPTFYIKFNPSKLNHDDAIPKRFSLENGFHNIQKKTQDMTQQMVILLQIHSLNNLPEYILLINNVYLLIIDRIYNNYIAIKAILNRIKNLFTFKTSIRPPFWIRRYWKLTAKMGLVQHSMFI